MTTQNQYIVKSEELYLVDLIGHVPEEQLTQYDPLVLASLRMQLEDLGLEEEDYELGEIYGMDEDDHGWFHLIDVTVKGTTLPARITISMDEIRTILHFGDAVAAFAVDAVALLAGPDETVAVGEVGADCGIDLAVIGASGEAVWWSRAAASQADILRAVSDELRRRWACAA